MNSRARISLLGVLALFQSNAFALGLGNIQVESHLNEPLRAEIQIIGANDSELAAASVSLGSDEDFARVGLEQSHSLRELNFEVSTNDAGKTVIVVSSRQAVREPFMSFLVEMNWSSGRILREYTLLLDPPVFSASTSGASAASASSSGDGYSDSSESSAASDADAYSYEPIQSSDNQQPDTSYAEPVAETPAEDPYSGYETSSETQGGVDDYVVQKGDTLWEIAREIKPSSDVTINEMMIALLRSNPDAFFDDNINALKSGAILRSPGAYELDNLSLSEALDVVKSHNALWQDYRGNLADAAPTLGETDYDYGSSSVASTDSSSSAYDDSRLELVPPSGSGENSYDDAQPSGGYSAETEGEVISLRNDLARSEEEKIAQQLENTELRSRLTDLESLVDKLERAVNIKDSDLAELEDQLAQYRAQLADQEANMEAGLSDMPDDTVELVQDDPIVEDAGGMATDDSMTGMDDHTGEEHGMDDAMLGESADDTAQQSEFSFEGPADSTDSSQSEPVAEPVAEPVREVQSAPKQPEWWEALLTNPFVLGGLAVLILLIGIVLWWRGRPSADDELGLFGSEPDQKDVGGMDTELEATLPDPDPMDDFDLDDDADDDGRVPTDVLEPFTGEEGSDEPLPDDEQPTRETRVPKFDFDVADDGGDDDDLDLDFLSEDADDGEDDKTDSDAIAAEVDGTADDADSDDFDLDFDLDFADDDAESDEKEAEEPIAAEADTEVEDDELEFDEMDFGDDEAEIPEPETDEIVATEPDAAADEDTDVEDTELEISFDEDDDEEAADEGEHTVEISEDLQTESEMNQPSDDLIEIDLDGAGSDAPDLDQGDEDDTDTAGRGEEQELEIETDDLFAGEDSIGTKLDLARAYMDMGDPDGAKGMLEEVLDQGSDEQKSEAEKLLKDI